MSTSAFESLLTSDTRIKVSSTLDKSVGKKYLTDGSPETCWTSQQGLPQWIQISFSSPVVPKRISLTFQGGFVGTRCLIEIRPSGRAVEGDRWTPCSHIFPEDVNRKQVFDITSSEVAPGGVDSMKLVFEESSDFFGRITVYALQLEGMLL